MHCCLRTPAAPCTNTFVPSPDTGCLAASWCGPGCVRGQACNGELFPVEASISQINVQGRQLFTVILPRYHQRLRDEQALRESEERLALVCGHHFRGIVASASADAILTVTNMFARMTGVYGPELVGRLIEELVVPEDRERVRKISGAHARASLNTRCCVRTWAHHR